LNPRASTYHKQYCRCFFANRTEDPTEVYRPALLRLFLCFGTVLPAHRSEARCAASRLAKTAKMSQILTIANHQSSSATSSLIAQLSHIATPKKVSCACVDRTLCDLALQGASVSGTKIWTQSMQSRFNDSQQSTMSPELNRSETHIGTLRRQCMLEKTAQGDEILSSHLRSKYWHSHPAVTFFLSAFLVVCTP
jgi:hypothetical protein